MSLSLDGIGAAFDGQNIWVTTYTNGTVQELRATDGTILRTVNIGAGSEPLGVAFDGANLWTANRGAGTVTEIRVSDGTVLGTFNAPDGPYGVAFDGTYIWLSGDLYTQVVRPKDGSLVAQWKINSTTGIAFDGAHVWVSNTNYNSLLKF